MVRPPQPAAVLAQHAADLARAFGVRLIVSELLKPEEALALPHLRAVFASVIVDETTYAVVLHEVGHLVAPTGALRTLGTRDVAALKRIEEDAAWTWARHYALDWTPAMEAVATWAEGTYAPPPAAPERPAAPLPATPAIDWNKW